MLYLTNFAQAPGTITTVEGVFGGRINAITGGKIGTTILSDTFRIFVATESANSIFYTYGHFPTFGTSTVDSFIPLPSANSTAGLGSSISKMAFHKNSQTLYFIASGNVYATTVAAASATKLTTTNNYADLIVEGNNFYSLTTSGSDNTVYYSTINASTGALTAVSNTTVSSQSYTSLVDGKDDKLYLFRSSTDPQALQFGGTFSAGINFAATTTDAMASLVNTNTWNCMGVYTDGTVFVGGTNGGTNPYKYVANSATFNPATYTTVATGINGTSGSNIEFRDGLLSNYYVYFGTAYSTSKGAISTWSLFGNAGIETHPNDGAVKFFNNNIANNGTLLLTTDAGLGITKNSGAIISDINNGILATQVEDFDMNSSKTFGWLAAKDGIRYVHNYNTAAKSWTTAFWPTGDGSPYYSAEMVANDTNSVYVGNLRIYKTTDKGTNWTKVFTPENAPYNYPSVGVRAEAIAVSDSLNNIVMAGYYSQNSGQYGGVFYSVDGGTNWSQLLINATVVGQDVNVNDIEMTTDSSKIVAYIGVEYINSTVRGMYKAQYDGISWTVRREEIYGASTSKFSVKDIAIYNKDTIIATGSFYNPALGYEYGINFLISRSTYNNWNDFEPSTSRQSGYTACAFNKDTIFYSYKDSILYDVISFNSTSTSRVGEALYSKVDIGTEINVMYYDELLVGSSTGFRSMRGATKIYQTPPTASVTISTFSTTVCNGNKVTINAIGTNAGNAPIYQWKKNNVILGSGSSITILEGMLATGDTVSCVLVVSNSINVTSNKLVFTVKQSPTIGKIFNYKSGAIVTTAAMCKLNDTLQLANATSNGGWSSSNNSIASIMIAQNTNNKLAFMKSNTPGATTITYNIVSSNGCMAATSVDITVAPLNTPLPITGANNVCAGSSINLSCSTPSGVWSTDYTSQATINSSTGALAGKNAGTIFIKYTVTNSFGCASSTTKIINVNAIPSVPSIVYAAGTTNPQAGAPTGGFCVGKNFNVAGIPSGGNWLSTGCIGVTNNGIATINTTGAGSLKYVYTNANGCSNSRTMVGTGYTCAARGTISNEQLATSKDFIVFPNPARNTVYINLENNKGGEQLIITDMLGKQVKTQILSLGNNNIDISNFNKGFYLISLIVDNKVQTKKLIVE